jgi:hypothetical protein
VGKKTKYMLRRKAPQSSPTAVQALVESLLRMPGFEAVAEQYAKTPDSSPNWVRLHLALSRAAGQLAEDAEPQTRTPFYYYLTLKEIKTFITVDVGKKEFKLIVQRLSGQWDWKDDPFAEKEAWEKCLEGDGTW